MLEQELVTEEWNLENLMFFLQESLTIRDKNKMNDGTESSCIKRIIEESENAQKLLMKLGYTIEQIHELYIQKGSEIAKFGRSPFATRVKKLCNQEVSESQFYLAIGTLKRKFPLFPYYYPYDDAKKLITLPYLHKDPLCKLLNYAVIYSCTKIEFMNGSLGKMALFAANHFVSDTLYPFLLLALINTGWNLESLLSLSDDLDAHINPDLLDPENYVLIHGKKVRGSSDGKMVFHRSNKKNKYGTYRLIKYVQSIITQYKDSPYYKKGYLWQYTISFNSNDKIIAAFDGRDTSLISKRFIERHGFKYISDTTIRHPKIRSGYVALRELLGATERELTEDLDHESIELLGIIHQIKVVV